MGRSGDSDAKQGSDFNTLCELSPMGIFSTDNDGNCTYTNPHWQKIFGLSLEESLGHGWQNGLHPDDKTHIFNTWNENAHLKKEFDYEFRTLHKNGDIRFVHSRAKPFVNADGILAGFIGTVQDITEQKLHLQEQVALLEVLKTQFIITITDLKGNITDLNQAFCDISQYSRQELIGKNHRVVNSNTHPTDFFTDLWKSLHNKTSWKGEICNRAKDGSLYWVDSVITPLTNASGKVDRFVSISTDITDRKHQQEELRKNRSLLYRISNLAGVGSWEYDLISERIYWSEETCRIYGVETSYVPTFEEAVSSYAPEAQELVRNAVNQSLETGDSWDLELPFIQKDGTRIWVRAAGAAEFENGKAVRLLGAFQEITERIKQRNALKDAHLRTTLATDSGKIGVWEYDLVKNTLKWDSWMYRLYGLAPNSQIESYDLWAQLLHPEDRQNAEQSVADAAAGIAPFDTEFRIIWPDKTVKYIRGTGLVTADADGKPIRMIGVNWDVSDIREVTEDLAKQKELLAVTLESIGDAVITTDAEGNTTWLNPVAQQLIGWSNEEVQGRPLGQIFHIVNEDTRLRTENPVETCLAQGKTVGLANHTVLIARDGQEYGIEDSAAPIQNSAGDVLGAVLVFHDVTEKRRLSNAVSYQATHDALTDLINRLEFETRLKRLIRREHGQKTLHALLYIDLDQFKIINDTCGHSVGDIALQRVSQLLQNLTRKRDTLARLGGDEFGIILEHCTSEEAKRLAQSICKTMEEFRFEYDSHRFRIGASIGLVSIDERWTTTAALMQAADKSCYAAKDDGRNCVHIWSESDLAIRTRHGEMQWTTRIESALDENRFELYTQHLLSLNSEIVGQHIEILVRMKDVDGSIIEPGSFLPAAERFFLATRIDRWVLKNAIDFLSSIKNNPNNLLQMMCINLSGQSIGDRAFHRYASNIFNKLGQDKCKFICLEITETATITNFEDASLFIEQVRNLGVLVALDDFGAGASSFGYLKKLSVDILKIDGQFIQRLLDDPLDEAAVRCFVEVAKIAKLRTVAEYVSSKQILDRVKELDIDFAQGFLIHKPEPIDKAIERE